MSEAELARLREENELLRREVRVAREAAQITANAVVRQFEETERVLVRLSDVSAQQKAVLDAASQVAVVAADRRGVIRLFNPGAEKLLGFRASEVVGVCKPTEYHLPEELEVRARALESETGRRVSPLDVFFAYAELQRTEVREWTLVRKDGGRVPVDMAVTPLLGPAGELTGFLCVALDLTARKRAEEEIRAAMEATEAANRTKSAFLANMSHELRTPLNAIIGYSEMLMEQAEDDALDAYVSDLQKIRSAGKHLLGLINDILDISRIEAGKVQLYLEELALDELVAEVARMVQPLVDKNQNALEIECEPRLGTMRADALRVRQVLFNLLGNASKFTHGGAIGLRVRAESDGARDWIVFDVADTGIGMSEEQLARLFQPFVQADASTTRKYGGSGLGLAISKQFCELMGGRIAVASEPGRGTTFTVRLPRVVEAKAPSSTPEPRRAPAIEPPARAPVEEESTRGAVLVIDDDAITRELLVRYLEREGFRVSSASSGDEGIARARAEHPDVITLDVMMPGKDGWVVLADLKADLSTADIPVVMLTIVDQRNAGYALGAADYLLKPVDRTRLLQLIERHVGRDGASRSALVVDDDDDLRRLLARGLAAEGYEVREAENGRVALDRLGEQVPGVILLDLMMPVMDGFVFLERLRERAEWRAVPVVVVTAMELSEHERLALHGFVEKVVQKGAYPQAELLAEVRRLVDAGLAGRARPRRVTA